MKRRSTEMVVLVNEKGRKTGIADKTRAHEMGLLHRAFSIFILNEKDEMLLQRRAPSKYHFAGLWSNACCSHPRPGEKIMNSAKRRLYEELGFMVPLKIAGSLTYTFYDLKSNLIEHEYDYVLSGCFGGPVNFNTDEVSATQWVSVEKLSKQLETQPEKFTPWFQRIMSENTIWQLIVSK